MAFKPPRSLNGFAFSAAFLHIASLQSSTCSACSPPGRARSVLQCSTKAMATDGRARHISARQVAHVALRKAVPLQILPIPAEMLRSSKPPREFERIADHEAETERS